MEGPPTASRAGVTRDRRRYQMPDRIQQFREAAQARHAATPRRAEAALRALASRGEAVSLRGLASAAGVSRSWLYRQPELHEEVKRLRRCTPAHRHSVPSDHQATVESLRQAAARLAGGDPSASGRESGAEGAGCRSLRRSWAASVTSDSDLPRGHVNDTKSPSTSTGFTSSL